MIKRIIMKKNILNEEVSRIKNMMRKMMNEQFNNDDDFDNNEDDDDDDEEDTSITRFIESYEKELNQCINILYQIQKSESFENLSEEEYNNLVKKMRIYDTNVLDRIEDMVTSDRISEIEIAELAKDNEYRYGTDAVFVLEAIKDLGEFFNIQIEDEPSF
jgi:hypothetical protein